MMNRRMNRFKGIMVALGVVGMCLLATPALAKIFKYVDENGKTHYTNSESSIPLKYRSGQGVKTLRGYADPSPQSTPSKSESPSGDAAGADESSDLEEVGLSSQDQKLVDRSITVLKNGIAMVRKFDGVQGLLLNYSNGVRLMTAIKEMIPEKEQMTNALSQTKVEELVKVREFLKNSLAADKVTQNFRQGLARYPKIRIMFDRVRDDALKQSKFIKNLEDLKKKSEKEKAAAAKAKAEKEKAAQPSQAKKSEGSSGATGKTGSGY